MTVAAKRTASSTSVQWPLSAARKFNLAGGEDVDSAAPAARGGSVRANRCCASSAGCACKWGLASP
jgi:hypothetical protein